MYVKPWASTEAVGLDKKDMHACDGAGALTPRDPL